ncbi:MAG: lipopolysaccharide biosynthesis protein [Nitrospira sp. CG24E]|nr:MAG: lipopolysaccharide biosynthesis protein [Nitrospira sp. CG24E]
MKDRIGKAVFWVGWSKGFVQFLSFLSTLYIARLLSPNDYGLLAMTAIWVGTLAIVTEMGLSAVVIQFKDLDERELNLCFWGAVGMAGVGYGVLYAAAPWIADWFGVPMICEILRVVSLTLPLTAIRIIPDGLLRKALALDKTSQAEILSVALAIPVQVAMASAGFGVWALVTGTLLMPVIQTVCTFKFSAWRPGIRMGSARGREILNFGSAKLGGSISWAVYEQADMLVLGKISGEVGVGLYSMAKQIALLPVHKISVVVNQIAFPLMAGLQDNVEQMGSVFLRQIRMVACLTCPLCIGLALVTEDLVWVALTEKWVPLVPVLQVLCVSSVVRSCEVLFPPILLARYRASVLFWWTIGLLLVMPIAFWAGAAASGGLGVALVWALVYPVMIAGMVQRALKEINLSWKAVWNEVAPILKGTLVMAISVGLLHSAMQAGDAATHMLRLVLSVGLGGLVYGGCIFWQGGRLVTEIVQLVRWVIGKDMAFNPKSTTKGA